MKVNIPKTIRHENFIVNSQEIGPHFLKYVRLVIFATMFLSVAQKTEFLKLTWSNCCCLFICDGCFKALL